MFQNFHEARTGRTDSPPVKAKLANLAFANLGNLTLFPLYSIPDGGPVAIATNILFGGGTAYLTYKAAKSARAAKVAETPNAVEAAKAAQAAEEAEAIEAVETAKVAEAAEGAPGKAEGKKPRSDMDLRVATGAVAVGLAGFGVNYIVTLALPNFEEEERARDAQQTGEPTPTSSPTPTSTPTEEPEEETPPTEEPEETPPNGNIEREDRKVLTEAEVERRLAKLAKKANQPLNWEVSIVDLMKLLGLDSSSKNRKELAAELGYKGDPHNSYSRNIWLQERIRQGLAENQGKVPDAFKN